MTESALCRLDGGGFGAWKAVRVRYVAEARAARKVRREMVDGVVAAMVERRVVGRSNINVSDQRASR